MPMPIADAMFMIAETRDTPMHVGGLQIFSPRADKSGAATLRESYERLLAQTDVAGVYRKRAYRSPLTAGAWAWQNAAEVDLTHHFRRSALPTPGRPLELMELVGRLHGTLLDRNRPLWETHFIEGMNDGRFAVYTKQHHAVADGISALRLAQSALSPDPEARKMLAPWALPPQAEHEAEGRGLLGGALRTVKELGVTAKDLAGMGPTLAKTVFQGLSDEASMLPFQAPRSMFNTSISGARRFAADSWSVKRVRALGKAVGGATVNDLVLAMSAGALRRYLLEMDALPDMPLVAMVPVSIRTEGNSAGNAVGSMLCNLGTHLADPRERLASIQDSMTKGKAALAGLSPLQITLLSAGVMGPPALGALVKAHDVTRPAYNLVISNVPGARTDLYFDGAKLDEHYPLSIPQQGQALNITVVGTGDKLGFGLIGCRRTVPHLQRLLGHLEAELADLENSV